MLLQNGIMAFFAAVGMATVVWLAAGLLLRTGRESVPDLRLVLPLRGEAIAMERDVRTLRRIQGQVPGATIVLEDQGLTAEARALARYLAEREENAIFITKEQGDTIP